MNSLESLAAVWLEHAGKVFLVFTAGMLLVALLRRPCRSLFGAGRAFQLWSLVPLMLLACELPQAQKVGRPALTTVFLRLAPDAAPMHAPAMASPGIHWPLALCLLWSVGALLLMLLGAVAQARYQRRLRDAVRVEQAGARWPIWRASQVDVGPALVGAWRPRIVLPADFEARYEPAERALIMAHETMHARRRDGALCLFAQLLRTAFWCHPLAWWAWLAFRHDQELACDAAVLGEHDGARRSYAAAMLKTQAAHGLLPVGCPWSPRHPVTERIAMLKLPLPSRRTRRIGGSLLMAITAAAAGAVYAATPAAQQASKTAKADHFTLAVDAATRGHPASMHFTQCLRAGEPFDISGSDGPGFSWDGQFAVTPAGNGQLEIRGKIHTRLDHGGGDTREMSGQPVVRTRPGVKASIVFGQKVDGDQLDTMKLADGTVRIDLTPTRGCSRAALAKAWKPAEVRQHVQGRPVREAARLLAQKGGFVLLNPEALDNRPVSFNFNQMSAVSAIQLLADIDGMRAVFNDKQVRFEPK